MEDDPNSPENIEKDSQLENQGAAPLLNEEDSRNGDLTQDRLNIKDKNIYDGDENGEIEKKLESDELENDSEASDELHQDIMQRTISEKEQPLDEVIRRNGDSIGGIGGPVPMKTARSDGNSKIQYASDGRGSKETSNGVLETPPLEESEDMNADLAAVEVSPSKKPKIFYSDKSESSVESMMADTPSNYNIMNGRFDSKNRGMKGIPSRGLLDKYNMASQRDKSALRKPKLDIISEIEAPSKAPSDLNTIKHVKTTHHERNFVESVRGSEKNSFMGDMVGGSGYPGRAGESDRGPLSDHNSIPKGYDIRSQSKTNLRQYPATNLEEAKRINRNLKYNQFMKSNGSSIHSVNGNLSHSHNNLENKGSHDALKIEENKKVKRVSGLPPIGKPKLKSKIDEI